ncbi:two pore domain potassium channel family protein [Nocardioides eburneiflavus]|uniref:Two pore domain potassium channel family protein n=1 Tax=Nocardioides eburneiflavus TaxID=2518372 RepID=A0A4Z1BZM4_9ACTN|nr:potassium channel family protein [Nocardioides eburneiflavus]TGN63154.1 two pore domain potassium channel family protein [Nocardioides eburneiflavus]
MADRVTDVDRVEHVVARRIGFVSRPVRGLVNAPHLLVLVVIGIWIVCSLVYALLEDKGPIEGLWWGIVTGSTVGYGDFYPSSTAGRAVGAFLIVSMLVLVPIAIGHVIANLVFDKESLAVATVLEDVHERIDRLEHLTLASLEAQHGREWLDARLAEHEAADAATTDVAERMLAMFAEKNAPPTNAAQDPPGGSR